MVDTARTTTDGITADGSTLPGESPADSSALRIDTEALGRQLLGTWADIRLAARERSARPDLQRIEGQTMAEHRGAEESPLHARLDLQARVGHDELFERGDVAAVVVLPAQGGWEGAQHLAVLDEQLELAEDPLAVLLLALPLDALHLRSPGQLS